MRSLRFENEPRYGLGYESRILGDYVLGNHTEFFPDNHGNLCTDNHVPNTVTATQAITAYAVVSTALAALVFRRRNMHTQLPVNGRGIFRRS